jgi:VWFA-related protein
MEPTPASGPPVVIFIDFLNTPVNDQAYAHQQIVRFIEQKPASTEVAIFALGNDLSMLQGFTTDSGKLLAAMRSKAAGLRLTAETDNVARGQATLDALFEIGRLLATMNGRKNLLWFSESFNMLVLPNAQDAEHGSMVVEYENGSPNPGPGATVTTANMTPSQTTMGLSEASASGFSQGIGSMMALREQMRKVATALAVSQTAVYPIDVRGLSNDPGLSASAAGPSSINTDPQGRVGTSGLPTAPGSIPASMQSHNDFLQSMNASHATMDEIADATGGHAFVNTNGLAVAAGQAVTEGSAYYTLVYAPSNLNFDGGLRSIHVTLDKPGCKLAYRSAYFAVDPATITPEDARSGALAAVMVRGTPDAQGLLFKAQIDPQGEPVLAAPDSPLANKATYHAVKKSKKPQLLSGRVQPYKIRLAILAQQLQLTAMPDGRRHAALEIAVYAYAADGQRLGGTTQKLEAAMPPVVYAQALENGMFHNLTVDLPVEAASLKLAILDTGSHHAGSLEVALPIPPEQQAAVPAGAATK